MIRAIEKRVVVELLPPKTEFLGEFSLPQGAIVPPSEGVVVSAGKEALDTGEIKIGEIAIFDKKFGVTITENGKTYRILEMRDILCFK